MNAALIVTIQIGKGSIATWIHAAAAMNAIIRRGSGASSALGGIDMLKDEANKAQNMPSAKLNL
jgi:hypothetical protein